MNSAERVSALIAKLTKDELDARVAHGKPAHHVTAITEFPVTFAQTTLAELNAATAAAVGDYPTNASLRLIRAFALVLIGTFEEADREMATFQALSPADPMGRMRFAALPTGKVHADLPAVSGNFPNRPSFFIGCDKRYLQVFGLPLLRSLAAQAPGLPVHLHLMDVDSRLIDRLEPLNLSITGTTEDPSAYVARHNIPPANYYNAARLLRFAEAAAASEHPLCTMDTDALAIRDPGYLLNTGERIGLRIRAGRLEPFHHFSACLVTGKNEPSGYMRAIAEITRRLMSAPFWGLDQYALFAAWIACRPALTLYGPDAADVTGITTDGTFAFTAGKEKGKLGTDDTPYARAFRAYMR